MLRNRSFVDGAGADVWLGEIDRRNTPYMRWVQQSLNRVDGAGLVEDGVIGPKTRAAVQRFQRRVGLVADGVVGPKTEAALIDAGAVPPPATTPTPVVTPAFPRPCCILAATISPFSRDSNLVDPSALGTHGSSSEANGLIYSGKAGFLDLGHMRETCDIAKLIHDQLAAAGGTSMTINTPHGSATIHTRVPSGTWLNLAKSISYDDALSHEIMTYDMFGSPGGHNSAFSPEDLCSNYLGTLVAERAINAGGSFNTAATTELNSLVRALDGQTKAESLSAFNLINKRWVNFGGVSDLLLDSYLQRRNFMRTPWKTGHRSDSITPAFVGAGFGGAETLYTFIHTLSRRIPKSAFPAEITRIMADAASRYGPDFDKP